MLLFYLPWLSNTTHIRCNIHAWSTESSDFGSRVGKVPSKCIVRPLTAPFACRRASGPADRSSLRTCSSAHFVARYGTCWIATCARGWMSRRLCIMVMMWVVALLRVRSPVCTFIVKLEGAPRGCSGRTVQLPVACRTISKVCALYNVIRAQMHHMTQARLNHTNRYIMHVTMNIGSVVRCMMII